MFPRYISEDHRHRADQLRALGVSGKGKSGGDVGVRLDTNAIYRVNENLWVCNFLDPENFPDSKCPCKRQKRGHNVITQEFWSDYNRNVKHAFDHSLSFKPYTTDPLDEDVNDGPHRPHSPHTQR